MYSNNTADRKSRNCSCVLCGAPKETRSSEYCDGCGLLSQLVDETGAASSADLALDRYDTCIYAIGFKGDSGSPVKIGWSTNVLKRLRSLQACNPNELEVVAVMRTARAIVDERMFHDYLADARMSGEWFRRTDRVRGLIKMMQEKSGPAISLELAGVDTEDQ